MDRSAVILENVTKIYPGGVRALDSVDLEIGAGEWVSLMGPSGSGKTTLMNLIDGLDRASEGVLRVLGVTLADLRPDDLTTFRREHIGLVFQQFHLIPYLTALENVMLAQYYHSMTDEAHARALLERVDMAHRADHLPSQLSGGEQQRVCIARALANDPPILLADEPTGNLDEANEEKVVEIFRQLHAEGRTLIVATHDPILGEAAERIIYLQHGKIVRDVRTANGRPRPVDESDEAIAGETPAAAETHRPPGIAKRELGVSSIPA